MLIASWLVPFLGHYQNNLSAMWYECDTIDSRYNRSRAARGIMPQNFVNNEKPIHPRPGRWGGSILEVKGHLSVVC